MEKKLLRSEYLSRTSCIVAEYQKLESWTCIRAKIYYLYENIKQV